MVPLVQMLEILNIKVIWMLMHLVIMYVIIAHYVRFLMVSITLGIIRRRRRIIIISNVKRTVKRFANIRNVLETSLP